MLFNIVEAVANTGDHDIKALLLNTLNLVGFRLVEKCGQAVIAALVRPYKQFVS